MATFNFFGSTTPPNSATGDNDVAIGVIFATLEAGDITGIRFWQPSGHSGTRTVALYNVDTTSLMASKVAASVSDGWNEVLFDSAQAISVGVTYVAVLHSTGSDYGYQNSYSWPATANGGDLYTGSTNAGRYDYNATLTRPTTVATNGTNFFVDVIFDDGEGGLDTITGTGDSTLAALSSSSTGSPVVTGSGTPTLAALSASSTATPVITGSGTPTLADLSSSSAASPVVTGSGTPSLSALTASSAGAPVVSASASVTLDALLSSGAGTPIIVGTGSSTLGVLVSAGTDVVTPGSLERTVTVSGRAGGTFGLTGHGAVASRTLSGSGRSGSTLQGHA